VASDRRLFLLVDGGTFSSAALFALLVRDNHLGLLIGEPVGTSTSFHGGELDLPISGTDYFLSVSTTRLERPDAAAGVSPTIPPDIFIPLSASTLAAGKDEAVDYVLRAATL
jgi:C-terminal processing protease CtpA/Prc